MQNDPTPAMKELADALATQHALDYSMRSLSKLDALADDAAIESRVIGAYLGEVLRRAAPDMFTWADDGALVGGSARWHPIDKAEKRRQRGKQDDLMAFASVVLAMTPSAAVRIDDAAAHARAEEGRVKVLAALEAFRAAPSGASVDALQRNLFGWLVSTYHAEFLRSVALRVDEFVPLLGSPPTGRGYERRDPGDAAARMILALVHAELETRTSVDARLRSRLSDRDKAVRTNAAFVLTAIDLDSGSARVALELGSGKDRAIVAGVLRGIRHIAAYVRTAREPPVPLAALAPVLEPALAPNSPHLAMALDVANDWSFRRELGAEAECVGDALENVAKRGKPQAARLAKNIRLRTSHAVPGERPVPQAMMRPNAPTLETLDGGASLAIRPAWLSILRELLREVGAVTEAGARRAMEDGPAVDADAAPIRKLYRGANELVTPTECRVIAERLRLHRDVASDVATFFDDAPGGSELDAWLDTVCDFHLRAVDGGGYRVR